MVCCVGQLTSTCQSSHWRWRSAAVTITQSTLLQHCVTAMSTSLYASNLSSCSLLDTHHQPPTICISMTCRLSMRISTTKSAATGVTVRTSPGAIGIVLTDYQSFTNILTYRSVSKAVSTSMQAVSTNITTYKIALLLSSSFHSISLTCSQVFNSAWHRCNVLMYCNVHHVMIVCSLVQWTGWVLVICDEEMWVQIPPLPLNGSVV